MDTEDNWSHEATAEHYCKAAERRRPYLMELSLRTREFKKLPDRAKSAQAELDRQSGEAWLFNYLCGHACCSSRQAFIDHLSELLSMEPPTPNGVSSRETFLDWRRHAIEAALIGARAGRLPGF